MKGNLGKFKVFLLMMPFIFFLANRSSADRWSGTGESVTASSIRVKGHDGSAVTEDELRSLGKIETPFKACKDVTFVDGDTYNKNEARWRAIRAGGLSGPTEVVPSTFVFKKWSGDKKISQRPGSLSGADFLLKVGDRAVADLKSGLDRYRALKTCVDSQSKTPACEELRTLFIKPIKETLPVFRQTLGQMKFVDPQMAPKIVMQRNWKAYVNSLGRASAAGVFGPKANVLLSGTDLESAQNAVRKEFEAAIESYKKTTEEKIAVKQLKGAEAESERTRAFDAKGIVAAGAYVHGKMSEFRAKKAIEYYQILNATPQLAYVSGEDPTDDAVIGKIIDRMMTDGEAQLVETENQLRTARASQKTKADGELSRDLLHFASYSAVIDRVLRDETKDAADNTKSGGVRYPVNCTIATALFNELKDAKTGDGLMLMSALITAPIGIGLGGVRATTLLTGGRLALSAEAAGHLAVAAGIGGGLASTAVDVHNGLAVERAARNELRTVDEAKDDINSANLAGPLGLLNFGGGKAVVGAVAGAAGKKLALSAGRREAVKASASTAAGAKQAASLFEQVEKQGKERLNMETGSTGRSLPLDEKLQEAKDAGYAIQRKNPDQHSIPLTKVQRSIKEYQPDIEKLKAKLVELRKKKERLKDEYKRAADEYWRLRELNRPQDRELLKAAAAEMRMRDEKHMDAVRDFFRTESKIETQEFMGKFSDSASAYALSTKEFDVSSPEINALKEKGTVSEVTITDDHLPGVAGGFSPETKSIVIHPSQQKTILDEESLFVEAFEHEMTHAKAFMKNSYFVRSAQTGELRNHPFLFEVRSADAYTNKQSLSSYDFYQHASEVTAFRAGGIRSVKAGNAEVAIQNIKKSNVAIERNLSAIRGARQTLSGEVDFEQFYFGYQQGNNSVVSFNIPIKNTAGETTHKFRLTTVSPIGKWAPVSRDEFIKYLDFLEDSNIRVRNANERTLRQLADKP